MGYRFEKEKMVAIGISLLEGSSAEEVMKLYDCGRGCVQTSIKLALATIPGATEEALHDRLSSGQGMMSAARGLYAELKGWTRSAPDGNLALEVAWMEANQHDHVVTALRLMEQAAMSLRFAHSSTVDLAFSHEAKLGDRRKALALEITRVRKLIPLRIAEDMFQRNAVKKTVEDRENL